MRRESCRAVSDADSFPGFPPEALPDAEAIGNALPALLQPLQCVDQASVADGAGRICGDAA